MLKKFTIRNYKNFREDLCIDFTNTAGYQFNTDCVTDGIISKMLIYGRNATGKTNLGKALMDISATVFPVLRFREGAFLNADTKEESAMFSYTFQFDGKEVVYEYTRSSDLKLENEELVVDGTSIYRCEFRNKKYEFRNLEYIGAETAYVERYLQSLNMGEGIEEESEPESRLPFFRWLTANVALEKDSILLQLFNYVNRMVMVTANNLMMSPRMYDSFYEFLENTDKLQDFEDFLNAMGIECKLKLKKLPDGQRELYFAHKTLVPFLRNASSGTLALMNLYRRIVSKAVEASFLYLDEFDAFYHYEMADSVVRFLKRRYPKCQIIMTSHNTNLMTNRLMRPDCLFILSRTGELTALCDATPRELREGHNLEKMYVSGEFEKYE